MRGKRLPVCRAPRTSRCWRHCTRWIQSGSEPRSPGSDLQHWHSIVSTSELLFRILDIGPRFPVEQSGAVATSAEFCWNLLTVPHAVQNHPFKSNKLLMTISKDLTIQLPLHPIIAQGTVCKTVPSSGQILDCCAHSLPLLSLTVSAVRQTGRERWH